MNVPQAVVELITTGRIPVTTASTTDNSFTLVNTLICDTELILYFHNRYNIDIGGLSTFIITMR